MRRGKPIKCSILLKISLKGVQTMKNKQVTILEVIIPVKNSNLHTIQTRVSEFDSLKEYLNLQAVGRTGLPNMFRLLNRQHDVAKQEVFTTLIDANDNEVYKNFAKVI